MRATRTEEHFQLGDLFGEIGTVTQAVTTQRAHGCLVGARCAAEAEVDAARIQRFQGAEILRHYQRRMVGQHHAAGADADALGLAGDVADQHGRGRAGDAVHVVVLRQPVAGKAQAFDVPGHRDGVVQCLGSGTLVAHGDQVEHGKGSF